MSQCFGIRGATTADANTRAAILGATEELLRELVKANHIAENDIAAVFFTTTPDLNAEFPAIAARIGMGWEHTAIHSSQEMDVPGATRAVVRVMLLVNTDLRKEDIAHVYLKGARNLRARGTAKQ